MVARERHTGRARRCALRLDDLKHLQWKRSPMHSQRVPDNLIELPHEAREEEGLARVARDGDVTRHPVRHEIAHELQQARPSLAPKRNGRLWNRWNLSRRCGRRLRCEQRQRCRCEPKRCCALLADRRREDERLVHRNKANARQTTRGRLEQPRPRQRLPPRTGRHRRRSRTRRHRPSTAHERRVETSALRTPLSRSRVRIGGGSSGGLWHRALKDHDGRTYAVCGVVGDPKARHGTHRKLQVATVRSMLPAPSSRMHLPT